MQRRQAQQTEENPNNSTTTSSTLSTSNKKTNQQFEQEMSTSFLDNNNDTSSPRAGNNNNNETENLPLIESQTDAPQDHYNIVYFILLFLGVALLLTYNSFVAAPDYTGHYYKYAAQDENLNATMPSVWKNISPFITAANMVPNLFCQIAMLSNFVQRIPTLKRLYFAIVLNAVAMLMVPIAPAFKVGEHGALAILLIGDAICGGATALLQSSAFAIAAQFPILHMQAAMLGIGVSGTLVSLLQIVTYAGFGNSFSAVLKQSSVFFGIGVIALFVLVLILPSLRKNDFARHFVLEWRRDDIAESRAQTRAPTAVNSRQPSNYNNNNDGTKESNVSDMSLAVRSENDQQQQQESSSSQQQQDDEDEEERKEVDVWRVLKICKGNMLANFFVYFISLIIFPGLGVAVEPDNDWYGIIIIFLFNFGDFSGRMLCRFERFLLQGKHHILQIFSACRIVFLPIFWLAVKPKLIDAPAIPMIVMYLVGISNGLTSSQLMMFTPAMEELESHERPTAGSAMSLSLLGGCAGGSLTALLLSQTYFNDS